MNFFRVNCPPQGKGNKGSSRGEPSSSSGPSSFMGLTMPPSGGTGGLMTVSVPPPWDDSIFESPRGCFPVFNFTASPLQQETGPWAEAAARAGTDVAEALHACGEGGLTFAALTRSVHSSPARVSDDDELSIGSAGHTVFHRLFLSRSLLQHRIHSCGQHRRCRLHHRLLTLGSTSTPSWKVCFIRTRKHSLGRIPR